MTQSTKAPVTASERRDASMRQGPAAFSMLKTAEKPDTNHQAKTEQATVEAAQARLAAVRAEAKELAAQIAASKPSKLDQELARQQEMPKWLPNTMFQRARRRVVAGQEQAEAIEAVLLQVKNRMLELFAAPVAAEPTQAEQTSAE